MSKFVMKTNGEHQDTQEHTDRFCRSRAQQLMESLDQRPGVGYEYTVEGEGEDTVYTVDQQV